MDTVDYKSNIDTGGFLKTIGNNIFDWAETDYDGFDESSYKSYDDLIKAAEKADQQLLKREGTIQNFLSGKELNSGVKWTGSDDDLLRGRDETLAERERIKAIRERAELAKKNNEPFSGFSPVEQVVAQQEVSEEEATSETVTTIDDMFEAFNSDADYSSEKYIGDLLEAGYKEDEIRKHLSDKGQTGEKTQKALEKHFGVKGKEDNQNGTVLSKGPFEKDDSKLGGGEGVGTYNAGNTLSVTKEIDDISNELVESTKKVSDDMINDLIANADKVLAGLGEDNYLKEIPMTITAMYDKGLIDKNQKNVMIANQIFTAIGNFSRGYQGKDRVQSQAEKIINSRLENATERYNKAKEAKIKAYTDVIDTDKTLNAQQRSKALDVLTDPKIQNLMTSFSEAESIRRAELLKKNIHVMQDLKTEDIALMLQLEMMAGNIEGKDILMNMGADLGIDLVTALTEGNWGPVIDGLGIGNR